MELLVAVVLGVVGGEVVTLWMLARLHQYWDDSRCMCGRHRIPDDTAGLVDGDWPYETVHEYDRCFPWREAVDIRYEDEGEGER